MTGLATVPAMADETAGSFRRRVLGFQLRDWLTFILAFVVGFAISAVLWTIVAGRDVQTKLTWLQTVLTFLTLVAALVALWYAAESAKAARDTGHAHERHGYQLGGSRKDDADQLAACRAKPTGTPVRAHPCRTGENAVGRPGVRGA